MKTLLTVAICVGAAALAGAQGRPAELLNRAVVQEETGQSPEKAIQAYKAVIAQFDEERKVAATALYRLGECYRKAGMRAEAQAAYQRVVREFSDQTALADPSRRQLMDTFGVSEVRTTRESQDMLRMQRDLTAARAELERSRANELRASRELATSSERTIRPMSIEEARLELTMTERRMADIKAKVDIGVEPKSSLDELMLQHAKDAARYQQLMADRQTSLTLSQQTLKSIQAEMQLVKQQIETMQLRVETGAMSPADPTLLQLQRDLLALQRKADEVSATIRTLR
jgi:tetratricopeptide (TPR) repeat protein